MREAEEVERNKRTKFKPNLTKKAGGTSGRSSTRTSNKKTLKNGATSSKPAIDNNNSISDQSRPLGSMKKKSNQTCQTTGNKNTAAPSSTKTVNAAASSNKQTSLKSNLISSAPSESTRLPGSPVIQIPKLDLEKLNKQRLASPEKNNNFHKVTMSSDSQKVSESSSDNDESESSSWNESNMKKLQRKKKSNSKNATIRRKKYGTRSRTRTKLNDLEKPD